MKNPNSTQHSKRRHYFIRLGSFANNYSLRWTDNATDDAVAERLGYERITRAEAIRKARAERERMRLDPSFAGYADSRVYPLYTIDRYGAIDDIGAAVAAPGPGIIADRE